MRPILLAATLAAFATTATAQGDPAAFLDGVYSSEAGCASGHQPLRDDGVTYLTPDGLHAIEYTCEFLDLHAIPQIDAFIAVAYCSAPGELTPELISVRSDDGERPAARVTVTYHGERQDTQFHRCADD